MAKKWGHVESDLAKEVEMKQLHHICLFCDEALMDYTTKSDWTYLANADKSPHRIKYECVTSWSEFKIVKEAED